jgi:hypothetical protein
VVAGLISAVGVSGYARAQGVAADGSRPDQLVDRSRYPYDPVCSWGRVSDGRGMIVRCLTRQEADQLQRKPVAPVAVTPATAPTAGASVPPASSAPAVPSVVAPAVAEEPYKLNVDVGPLVADVGRFPQGEKKLREPRDRYLACVQQNGGLSEDAGEVVLRFLVRERGRAEGVSVSKRRAVSKAAASCLADVVDRRFVGEPDEPMVGASLTLKFAKQR